MSANDWSVIINAPVITWIRARSSEESESFEHYENAISSIWKKAEAMNEINYVFCGEGFIVNIPEEDVFLRCGYFMTEKEIHVISVL